VLGVGVSVDLTHAYSVKSNLQSAVDAAALAVGANSPNATTVTTQMNTVATDVVTANVSLRGGVTVTLPTPPVVIDADGQSLTVTASAKVPTTFLQVAGISNLTVNAASTALRSVSGLEVAVVLDNTASLSYVGTTGKSNFVQLQTAAKQLTTALFGSTTTSNPLLRVGVVPYTGAVNPNTAGTGKTNVATSMISSSVSTKGWNGNCLVERYGTFSGSTYPVTSSYSGSSSVYSAVAADLDNPVATAGYLLPYLNSGTGCPTAVQPLINSLAPITAAITAMNDNGGSGTVGSVGVAWGYRLLSPSGPFAAAGAETVNAWSTPKWKKVMVLMTDGVNEETNAYNGFGEVSGSAPGKSGSGCSKTEQNYNTGSCESGTNYDIGVAGISLIDAQEEAVCDALRFNGVTIFSVFVNSNSTAGPAISYCAGTQPGNGANSGYFFAVTNDTLVATFTAIGEQLTNLRLTK
jgi:hypothetical protein